MNTERELRKLGVELPPSPPPVANYVNAVLSGNLLFLSGHGPSRDGTFAYYGKLGTDVSIEEGYACARLVMLNLLATAAEVLGDLDRVRRVVKVLGMVRSAEGFTDQPKVIDGASDLLVRIFGERGRHARSAVGMAELPFGIPVEIEMILEVEVSDSKT